MQVLPLRAALLAAIEAAPDRTLTDNSITQAVFAALGLDRNDRRGEYVVDEKIGVKGVARLQIEETMRNMLGYRLYYDLRRSWRLNNPDLGQLGILRVAYQDLDDLAADVEVWADAPTIVARAAPDRRRHALALVLDAMRQGLSLPRSLRARDAEERQLKMPQGAVGLHRG